MSAAGPLEQQRTLYGAPLAELVGQVTSALGLTQGRLAEVLGLSAPMLSQLLSGQRVKIGNPAVVHRLQSVLTLAGRAGQLSPSEVADSLAAIRNEQATLTGSRDTDLDVAARALARLAGPDELRTAGDLVTSPALAAALRRGADLASRG